MAKHVVSINRAPVLTLWAAVVAERLGFRRAEALTLGKAVAGLNAQAKGRRLGIYKPGKERGKKRPKGGLGEEFWVEICGRPVPAVETLHHAASGPMATGPRLRPRQTRPPRSPGSSAARRAPSPGVAGA